MKKIFFLLSAMNVGGVEKAFLNMLPYIPKDKYEIHLGLLAFKGGFLVDIPSYVHIHHISCFDLYKSEINNPPLQVIVQMLYDRKIGQAFIYSLLYMYFKLTKNRYLFYKYLLKDTPVFPIHFDLAVAYAGPSQAIDYYINKKVNADKKCGWIHFDINKFGIDEGMTRKLYVNYDKIFLVSQSAKEHFDQRFPTLSSKTDIFYNIVSPQLILKLSAKAPTFTDNFTGSRILTVGRLSAEKGPNYAIRTLKILKDKGYNVRWYFVGDGNFKPYCQNLASELGVEEDVVFLGTQKNPYGFMRDCDIYMQPSRHEGYCITLAEARVFNSPIVSTDFVGAREQLSTRPNGVITDFDEEDMARGVIKALSLNQSVTNTPEVFHTDINKLLDLLN